MERHRCSNKIYAVLAGKPVVTTLFNATEGLFAVMAEALAVMAEALAVTAEALAAMNENKAALIEAFTVFSTVSRLSTIVSLRYFLPNVWSGTLYFLT